MVPETLDDNQMLNTREVAAILRVSRQSVVNRIKSGLIPAAKEGRNWLIARADLNEYLAKLRAAQYESVRKELRI